MRHVPSTARLLPRLKTPRTLLRLADEADIAEVLRYLTDNREFLQPFEPLKPSGYYTSEFWRLQIQRSLYEFHSDLSARFFVFKLDAQGGEERIVGSANFTQIVRGPFQACYLGYGLDRLEQGKGLMTEALSEAIRYVLDELNLHRIMANYMPRNQRSARVLERLGFVIEGQAKDYLQVNGRWEDHVLTSLTHPHWRVSS